MDRFQGILLSVALAALLLALIRLFSPGTTAMDIFISEVASKSATLQNNQKILKDEFSGASVIPVGPDIFVAYGYALANVILLRNAGGCAIIDTTESVEAAENVRAALEEVLGGPCNVTDIVYTHNHQDHVGGATVFRNWTPESAKAKIWAHKDLPRLRLHSAVTTGNIVFIRAMRQFGALLPESAGAGIGPRLQFTGEKTTGYLPPTHFLNASEANINLAGIPSQLIHIPGETDDQLAVYLPKVRALFCGDDLYKAFPNLYAIRGTPFRSLSAWTSSLDRMLDLGAAHLVPSHTKPISGTNEVAEVLTVYRDAVQFVHDQAVRFLNRDMAPDEIVEKVKTNFPKALEKHPFLRPLYGTVEWSVRSLLTGYMGWFSGRPEDLTPLSRKERGKRVVALAGGEEKALVAATTALEAGDAQWALELATAIGSKATELRIKAMVLLAHQQTSANGYNYYMTSAYEAMGRINTQPSKRGKAGTIREMPIEELFRAMSVRFRAEECGDLKKRASFRFTDSGREIGLKFRHGVALVGKAAEDAEVRVETTETAWKDIVTGERSAFLAVATSSDLKVWPNAGALREVMDCFERE